MPSCHKSVLHKLSEGHGFKLIDSILLQKIAMTYSRIEIDLWSSCLDIVYTIKLTLPWEDSAVEASQYKSVKYVKLPPDMDRKTMLYHLHVVAEKL